MDPDEAAKKWVDANPDKVEGLAGLTSPTAGRSGCRVPPSCAG